MNADYLFVVCVMDDGVGESDEVDCSMCTGSACNKCGAGCWSQRRDCEHDVMERHEAAERE